MPDITKCKGDGCPVKIECYRYTSIPDEHYQAYFASPPIKNEKCDFFWGELQESIYSQLKQIVKPNKKNKNDTTSGIKRRGS